MEKFTITTEIAKHDITFDGSDATWKIISTYGNGGLIINSITPNNWGETRVFQFICELDKINA